MSLCHDPGSKLAAIELGGLVQALHGCEQPPERWERRMPLDSSWEQEALRRRCQRVPQYSGIVTHRRCVEPVQARARLVARGCRSVGLDTPLARSRRGAESQRPGGGEGQDAATEPHTSSGRPCTPDEGAHSGTGGYVHVNHHGLAPIASTAAPLTTRVIKLAARSNGGALSTVGQ